MLIFSKRYTATVLRQTYTNNVSAFTTVATVTGNLRALDVETASKNGMQYGNGFSFITELGSGIQTGDKLTINGVTYTVSGVASYGLSSDPTAYLKALITLPE